MSDLKRILERIHDLKASWSNLRIMEARIACERTKVYRALTEQAHRAADAGYPITFYEQAGELGEVRPGEDTLSADVLEILKQQEEKDEEG